ncbi:tol-pal system-associated acyl-CoA thioesterase [Flocculibacter collagenilyticus]|uniref:tol-pal system-associated acyl-CoA thioesterase n=1 Tax=Flocculibacter collagenilyticus TaxID=2744479 RepID=UPI0018F3C16C|nr:tol-pal system-associated acyl-CoA thioesterase [Flocculibacter collagenilyticus]
MRFSIPIRIYYEDTDAGGIVYYANYLKFYERARTEWLRDLGIEQDGLLAQNIGFVVKHVEVDNKLPAKFNDEIIVSCETESVKSVSIVFKQQIHNQDGLLINSAKFKVACVDLYKMKPLAIPKQILEVLKSVS